MIGLYSSRMLRSRKIVTEELYGLKEIEEMWWLNAAYENREAMALLLIVAPKEKWKVEQKILQEKMTENFPLLIKAISLRKSIPVRGNKTKPDLDTS